MARKWIFLLAGFVAMLSTPLLLAQEKTPYAFHLKDGSVIVGTVVEVIPNTLVKVKTRDGSIFVCRKEEIQTITRAEVRGYAGTQKSTMFGLVGGVISPGTVYFDSGDFDTDFSYSLGGLVDYQLAPKLYGGLSFDLHDISARGTSKTLLNFGLTLKAVLGKANSNFFIRPGVMLGYGRTSNEGEDAQFFTVGAKTELLVRLQRGFWLVSEIALYASPAGGNAEEDITFGPVLLVRSGLVF
ncbi:MAG: hypothetical protein ACE5IY_08875 [bacterium]